MVSDKAERMTLTFDAFRAANATRCEKWHPQGIDSWSPSDWLTAVAGEMGELASLLKMRNRERDGLPGNKFSPSQKQIADELADVVTYLDLLAHVLGVDLGAAVVEKFNEVSERVGFSDRLEPSQSPPAMTWQDEPSGNGWHWIESMQYPRFLEFSGQSWWASSVRGHGMIRLNGRRVCPIPAPPKLPTKGAMS